MKIFALAILMVFPSLALAQTPSIYDTWRPTFDFEIAPVLIITPNSLSAIEPSQFEAGNYSGNSKQDTLYSVVYDSAQVKGRLFVKSGKNIVCMYFHLSDDGIASFGIDKLGDRPRSQTLQEVIAATSRFPKYYEVIFRLNSSSRYKMFSTLKDPVLIPKDKAIALIKELTAILKPIVIKFRNASPLIALPTVLSDFTIRHGYNPLRGKEAVDHFKEDPEITKALDDMGDTLDIASGEVPKQHHRKNGATIEPPSSAGGNGYPPPQEYQPGQPGQIEPMDGPGPIIDIREPYQDDEPHSDDFIVVESEPKPLDNIQSIVLYPETAKRAGIEGSVDFQALIDENGKVLKVIILKSDSKLFDQEVIAAVRKIRFTPAMQNKKPVKYWYTSKVKFSLR